jgi:hypothetical protein
MNRFFAIEDITTPEHARKHLADPNKQWREGYSAYELATCWLKAGGFPASVRSALDAYPPFKDAELIEAFFERKVDLGTAGHPSQNDLLVYAKIPSGFVAIAVEGKVKESFGQYAGEMTMTPGLETRQIDLAGRLGLRRDDLRHIRYQLLHRTLSALLEAERYHANHALMLVHSFSPEDTSFQDYRAFASLLGMPAEGLRPDRIVGWKDYGPIRLHLGWVRDVPTVSQAELARLETIRRPVVLSEEEPAPPAAQADLAEIVQRVKKAIYRSEGGGKKLSSISSNISSGFKAKTSGKDYKQYYYDEVLRGKIAEISAYLGVPVSLVVELVVAMKDSGAKVQNQTINDILKSE